jgi:hypothetical protein
MTVFRSREDRDSSRGPPADAAAPAERKRGPQAPFRDASANVPAQRKAATVAAVLFSTRWLWLTVVVPMAWPP